METNYYGVRDLSREQLDELKEFYVESVRNDDVFKSKDEEQDFINNRMTDEFIFQHYDSELFCDEDFNANKEEATKTGSWYAKFDITLNGEDVKFYELSEESQEHILNCLREGCFSGEVVE